MKKLILLLLISASASAQFRIQDSDQEYFIVSSTVDPNASRKEHGLNIGAEIEYSGRLYVRASVNRFEALKDGYTDFIGAIGVNFTSGHFGDWRYYSGIRLGAIKRKRANATAGAEIGIDYMISDNFFAGLRGTLDYRSDFEFYDYPNQIRPSGFIRIGLRF